MHKSKILLAQFVTHDVRRFILEKPQNYKIQPGSATEISIDAEGFEHEKRPFTFTSFDKDEVLEFTIKRYDSHNGVTKKLHSLNPGDSLLLDDPFDTIKYSSRGVFIAGGAGITPFIPILRDLRRKNEIEGNCLLFSNKTHKDIILEKEFKDIFSNFSENLIFTLTDENNPNYENKKIDKDFLLDKINDFSQKFYICGPPKMGEEINNILKDLGADVENIVFE
ncbi:flavodoxin reductase [Patescibacteria group bacterium]|nr:flavodoxin reductase [Patescibacteria group bacterium]